MRVAAASFIPAPSLKRADDEADLFQSQPRAGGEQGSELADWRQTDDHASSLSTRLLKLREREREGERERGRDVPVPAGMASGAGKFSFFER